MKRLQLSIPIVLLFCAVLGCKLSGGSQSGPTAADRSKITTANAQDAINRFVNNRGSATIQGGVREITTENVATAELNFSNFTFNSNKGGSQTYSGKGIATFSHYTDGRWVLSKVTAGDGIWVNWIFDPNVEVH